MRNLLESLKRGDLKGLVGDVVSIGEYISRIDDNVEVLTFSCVDKRAANDLKRFIQKSHVDILNASVSKAPNSKGDYIIFVEMFYSKDYPKNVSDLVYEVSNVTKINNWNVSIKKNHFDGISNSKIAKIVSDNHNFKKSSIEVDGVKYKLVSKGSINQLKETYSLKGSLSPSNMSDSYQVSKLLYGDKSCIPFEGYVMIKEGTDGILLERV